MDEFWIFDINDDKYKHIYIIGDDIYVDGALNV